MRRQVIRSLVPFAGITLLLLHPILRLKPGEHYGMSILWFSVFALATLTLATLAAHYRRQAAPAFAFAAASVSASISKKRTIIGKSQRPA